MRMRAIIATAAGAAVLGALLAGCTAAPRAHDGPLVIPAGIAWRYAMSCIDPAGNVAIESLQWSNAGAEVHLESGDPRVDIPAVETQIEDCLTAHRYEEHVDAVVDPYERERLYEYYAAFTVPCLAREGVSVDPLPRFVITAPDGGEPWNPYLGMNLPFDRLMDLYQACPPRPASLTVDGAG
jgi:hypothetical protein